MCDDMAFPADQKILYCLTNRIICFHNNIGGLVGDFLTLNIRLYNIIKFLNIFILGGKKCSFNQPVDACNWFEY